jgi:hypothetical protein
MQFAGTDENYDSTWFAYKGMAFIVDRDKPRETLSTVSMNFIYNFLANITPFILAVLCSLISDFLGIRRHRGPPWHHSDCKQCTPISLVHIFAQ